MYEPADIDDAICNYVGFDEHEWLAADESEIRELFTRTRFVEMFGADDAGTWDWTFRELADRAIELVADARVTS